MAALLGNHVDLNVNFPAAFASTIQAGKIRAIAIGSEKRVKTMPDVPTLKELGYDVEAYQWTAILAPAKTPEAVVMKLRQACKAIIAKPAFAQGIEKMGDEVKYLDGPEFASYWKKEASEIDALFKSTKMQ